MKNLGTFFLKRLVFRCPFIVLLSCVFLSFAAVPMSVRAANVYIDPSATYNGDGTAGTQAAGAGQVGAFNTWSSVTFSSADDYYQKCGTTETIGSSLTISNIIATSGNRMVVGAYYLSGGEQISASGNKPIIKRPDITGSVIVINKNSTYITIENLDLQRGSTCIYGTDADYLLIQNNDIGEGSAWGIRLHGVTRQLYGTEIKNNTIDSHILTYGQVAETNLWDAIQLFNSANNYKIYNNTILDFGHTGIQLWGMNNSYTISNCDVYNNYIDGANSTHLRGFEMMGTYVTDNTVHQNYMTNLNSASKVEGIRNEVYYNIISNVRDTGIVADGIGLQLTTSRGECHHNKVYNNIIYKTDNAGIRLQNGTDTNRNLEYNEITNNILLETGNCKISGSGCDALNALRIYVWGGDSIIQNNTYKTNVVYTSGKTTNMVYYKKSFAATATQYDTKTAFEIAKNGVDGNTISGNIDDDPVLTDPAAGDFSFSSDSPYKNLGVGIPEGIIVGVSTTPSVVQPPVKLRIEPIIQQNSTQ